MNYKSRLLCSRVASVRENTNNHEGGNPLPPVTPYTVFRLSVVQKPNS